MVRIYASIVLIFFFVLLSAQENANQQAEFIKGVDLSALLEIEDHGGVFKENGISRDALLILKDHGVNFVRLRIWHRPVSGYNNLAKTALMAERIKSAGCKFLLDFHYSDTWADPGRQTKPAAWQNLAFQALQDSLYHYTRAVITILKNQNTLPDMVQLGNEIVCGMLWNDGRVCDQQNTPQQWAQLAALINAGVRGVNDSIVPDDSIKIVIHIDRGGDNSGCRWFFDHLLAQNVDFDIIGLSYYPWWHGALSDLAANVHDLAQRYGKEILLVETAYPWTLAWTDDTNNIVGTVAQLDPDYPATIEGQTSFLKDLIQLLRAVPANKGLGLFYWAPEWISAPRLGSPWENVALFDFAGELLNSITAFDSMAADLSEPNSSSHSFRLQQNYPNPFNPETTIRFELARFSYMTLKIYNALGAQVRTLIDGFRAAGEYAVIWDGQDDRGQKLNSGLYLCSIQSEDQQQSRKLLLLR
ncbi:glycosyl hydrolase 53 family protein [candidate division KSB1 bacterium]|nr:glycosyl hydrolase 53 family protein [candidate division KSB1 bacterium]RQW07425.1 MAG: T9SS C-terminal target domain-containing protein [candidate division KSB1 bacterium]